MDPEAEEEESNVADPAAKSLTVELLTESYERQSIDTLS